MAFSGPVSAKHPMLAATISGPLSASPFTSSLHVYGRTQHLPPPRTVTDPVQPFEHYACHKVACEEMIRASGLSWAILRLAATLPLALKLDPGMFDVPLNNRIEYIHTRDVGLALANAVSSDDIWGKTLLIGGGPRCQFTYQGMIQPRSLCDRAVRHRLAGHRGESAPAALSDA